MFSLRYQVLVCFAHVFHHVQFQQLPIFIMHFLAAAEDLFHCIAHAFHMTLVIGDRRSNLSGKFGSAISGFYDVVCMPIKRCLDMPFDLLKAGDWILIDRASVCRTVARLRIHLQLRCVMEPLDLWRGYKLAPVQDGNVTVCFATHCKQKRCQEECLNNAHHCPGSGCPRRGEQHENGT